MEGYIATIMMFAGNFAPRGWAFCNGQLMSIAQNTALFSLIGTTYGGDGTTTFALPNMQGRLPMHWGTGAGLTPRVIGEIAGEESVTLLVGEMPAHVHVESPLPNGASSTADTTSPIGNFPAPIPDPTDRGASLTAFSTTSNGVTGTVMSPMGTSTGVTGGSQPHDNMPPYLCVSFIICVEGIFPSRN